MNDEGMLVDFALLKGHVKEVLSELDHTFINEIPFFKERAASSEYIAMYLHDRLQTLLKDKGVAVSEIRVWESDNVYAAFKA